MNWNSSQLLNLILNDADIVAAVDTHGGNPAIWEDVTIPADFTGNKSINLYLIAPANMSLPVSMFRFSASCRALTYGTSRDIAILLTTKLNRYLLNQKNIKMTILPTLPPKDATDNNNTPVEITFTAA